MCDIKRFYTISNLQFCVQIGSVQAEVLKFFFLLFLFSYRSCDNYLDYKYFLHSLHGDYSTDQAAEMIIMCYPLYLM